MDNNENREIKKVGILGIVIVTVVAIDSLRNLPFCAKLGWWVIPLFAIGAIGFMVPTAIASAELTSRFPQLGGISVWVRHAFGKPASFVVVWIQWIYNIMWFPSITAFAITHFLYGFGFLIGGERGDSIMALQSNNTFIAVCVIILFWIGTAINSLGIKRVSIFSGFSTILGTFVPMLFIILLSLIWLSLGGESNLHNSESITGGMGEGSLMGLFGVVLFSLLGLEISSAHAGQVENPRKNYPRALWILVLVVPLSLILSALAMGALIAPKDIGVINGLIECFKVLFDMFGITNWALPIMAFLIFFGAMGTMAAWSFGISRYLKKTAEMGYVPKWLGISNKNGVPTNAMIFQGCVVSFLAFDYLLFAKVETVYSLFTLSVDVLSIGAYVMLFVAVMYLRNKYVWEKGVHYTWGTKAMSFTMYIIGIVVSVVGALSSFIAPESVSNTADLLTFDFYLLIAVLVAILIPILIIWIRKALGHDLTKDVKEIMDDMSEEEKDRMY